MNFTFLHDVCIGLKSKAMLTLLIVFRLLVDHQRISGKDTTCTTPVIDSIISISRMMNSICTICPIGAGKGNMLTRRQINPKTTRYTIKVIIVFMIFFHYE